MIQGDGNVKRHLRFRFPAILDRIQRVLARAVEPEKLGSKIAVDRKACAVAGHRSERVLVESLIPILEAPAVPQKGPGKG